MSGSPEARTALRKLQHDMRTPIGQILGYSEMLEEEAQDRGIADLLPDLQRIRGAARRLLELVEQVFQDDPVLAQGAPAPERERGREAPAEPGAERAGEGRLLVVDDEPSNRDLLARRLAKRGFAVRTAGDGRTALQLLADEPFDLVLLDVMMPGMSGLEVLEILRRTRSASELPVIMATALDRGEDTVAALSRGANDYVTKPLDFAVALARIESQLELLRSRRAADSLARELEFRNAFIRRTFGRYVSDEVVTRLLDEPEALGLRGEKRTVTILLADLRGFSSLAEALPPSDVVALLNNYLGEMSEVIHAYGGTIAEFIGDAILAFFGAPVGQEDDVERAVACAVAMQAAMAKVNQSARRRGLPEVEMGIGIATGDVVVGNVGSEKRTKYGAVGRSVNLAARIESYTLGGEILICDDTRAGAGSEVLTDVEREVHPKGFASPLRIHRVVGFGDHKAGATDGAGSVLLPLPRPLAVRFAALEGKAVGGAVAAAEILALSSNAALVASRQPVEELADLRFELVDAPEAGAAYAKVVGAGKGAGAPFTVRFTMRPPAFVAALERARAAQPER